MIKKMVWMLLAILAGVEFSSGQSVLLSPTSTQTVTQPSSTTLSVNSLNSVGYVDPASSVDIVTQINALSSNCSSTCVIHVPAGSYTTTATTTPITLQPGQSLVGDGEANTTITGNPTEMIYWHGTGGFPSTAGQISDLTIICGPATTECIDTGDLIYAKFYDLTVYGAYNGDCISMQNTASWFERSQMHNVTVGFAGVGANLCNVGIHLKPYGTLPNVHQSFGYFDWGTIYQNSSNIGILVDPGANLYNGSNLSIQDNIGSGDALQVGGVVNGGFITVQGEGSGYGIHTTGTGQVRGCGNSSLALLADNLGPNPDSNMAIDLLQCLTSNGVSLSNYNGGGPTTFVPKLYQGNPQVDAGVGFMMQGSTGYSAPVLWYDGLYPLTMGSMEQYQDFGSIATKWSLSGQGDATGWGSLTAGAGAGCNPAPGAQTGNNTVWSVLCGQNVPIMSFQSSISNSGAKTWGFYSVRTYAGDSQFHFGTQTDAYAPNLDVWACDESGGTPTGCTFNYANTFSGPATFSSSLAGTTASFSGATTFSGANTFSGASTFSGSTNFTSGITVSGGPWSVDGSGNTAQNGSVTAGSISVPSGSIGVNSGGTPNVAAFESISTYGTNITVSNPTVGLTWGYGIEGLYSPMPGAFYFNDNTGGTTPLQLSSTGIVATGGSFSGAASFASGVTVSGGPWSVDGSGDTTQNGSLTAGSISVPSGTIGVNSASNPNLGSLATTSTYGLSIAVSDPTVGLTWSYGIEGLYSPGPGAFYFTDVTSGTTPLQLGSAGIVATGGTFTGAMAFGSSAQATIDTSGNFTTTGNLQSAQLLGPASAPSGSCATSGAWVFSQDGHATFCSSGTWVTKI